MISKLSNIFSRVAELNGVVRTHSCGFIIEDNSGRWLICHSTGNAHWDFPKGAIDPGETAIAAALRELQEETGFEPDLTFPGTAIKIDDLGKHPYSKNKDLQLFYMHYPRALDTSCMKCISFFENKQGKQLPEMDAFALEHPSIAIPKLGKSMQAWVKAHVLPNIKDLK